MCVGGAVYMEWYNCVLVSGVLPQFFLKLLKNRKRLVLHWELRIVSCTEKEPVKVFAISKENMFECDFIGECVLFEFFFLTEDGQVDIG